jgi:hypothetical protein
MAPGYECLTSNFMTLHRNQHDIGIHEQKMHKNYFGIGSHRDINAFSTAGRVVYSISS